MEVKLTDQERARRDKLARISALGVDPFGQKFERTDTSATVKEKAQDKTNEQLEAEPINVIVAGRIMLLRKMGKAAFFTLRDLTGDIQCYIRIDTVGEENYALFKCSDVGDIVGIEGRIMLTDTGEVTIRVGKYTNKYHG